MLAALAIFGALIWLFARRTMRQRQQPAFASYTHAPSRERLNQLHQLLPSRDMPSPVSEEEGWEPAASPISKEDMEQPLPPPSGLPWSSPPKPPQWLIDAGLFQGSAKEEPPEAPEEP